MKNHDEFIRFVFITGLSCFSKISIFSDLNSPNEITLISEYNNICGYTEEELVYCFDERIGEIAKSMGKDKKALYREIKENYNGYNFTGESRLYNPWSILKNMRF